MNHQKLLFIFNPKSGMGLIRNSLVDIIDTMVKAGYEVTTYTTQAPKDATRKVMEDGAGYDRIICSGGDGTLDEVVTGIREAKLSIPLGYIPAGSTNDFATSLGIPGNMVKAAEIALGDNTALVDIGKFNEDTFVYIAAFGIFTEISYETPQDLKNMLGHLAYILSAVKSLASIPNRSMRIEVGDRVIEDSFIYGMITNSLSAGGFKGITGKNVKLDDGEFEVTLIRGPQDPLELNEIVGFLTGIIPETKMVYSFKAKDIRLTCTEEVPWTLDGEFGGCRANVEIHNLCKKLQIVVPKAE